MTASLTAAAPAFPDRPRGFLLHYMRRHLRGHALLLAVVLAATGCTVAVQYATKLLVDGMAGGPAALHAVMLTLAVFVGLIGLESALGRLSGFLGSRVIPAVGVAVRLDLFKHLTGHSSRFFADQFSGALANRIGAAANAVEIVEVALTWRIAPPLFGLVASVAVLAGIKWQMAAALSLVIAFAAFVLARVSRRGRALHAEFADRSAAVSGELVDVVTNMWTVRAFSATRREYDRVAQKLGLELAAHRRSWVFTEKLRVCYDLGLWAVIAGMLGWAVTLWGRGQLTAGDVVAISSLSFTMLNGSRDLAMALVEATQQFGRLGDALQSIAAPHQVTDAAEAGALIDLGGSIGFESARFSYPDGRTVLNDFSCWIPAGQKVGIVGPSGAGKSTLLALVQRLYDVESGRVLIDAQDVAQVAQESLHSAIAVVPQDISLFHRSVLENLRYGRPDATDEEVFAAARAARCDDFIRALPEGYDTLVGERGTKLSGGQRQRVGIARAILKNAPIILLDEATSALDTDSEYEIQEAFRELMRGRTVLAVAHRLSTLTAFDRILVMKDGQIAEDGSPAQLRRQGGTFARMWAKQAGGFIAEDAAA